MITRSEEKVCTMGENSLINFDYLETTLNPEHKVELKRKTKDTIMSLYKDGSQLVNLLDPLFVSTMNASEFADISEFDPLHSRNGMNLCSTMDTSINKTGGPNGFPISNHKNMTTCRVRIENTRRDTENPNETENTNTQEWKDTPVNPHCKVAYKK